MSSLNFKLISHIFGVVFFGIDFVRSKNDSKSWNEFHSIFCVALIVLWLVFVSWVWFHDNFVNLSRFQTFYFNTFYLESGDECNLPDSLKKGKCMRAHYCDSLWMPIKNNQISQEKAAEIFIKYSTCDQPHVRCS